MDKVAVVILNWNGSDMMRKYLPGVVACTETTSRAKVYVADNGSTDGSMEMVGENFPTVGKIQLDRNYGFAEGYNKSLRLVEAEYYV
ncbi:MAG: glycosyltransferase, partial [Bacteroidaceae bacterium]|nr:glycosyltransferase [Bacteroidaceae bacterium]